MERREVLEVRFRSGGGPGLPRPERLLSDSAEGVVTLPCSEREVSAPQGLLGGPDRRLPRVHGSGANGRIWPAMMSAELPEGWA
jgi:hypothetical protein